MFYLALLPFLVRMTPQSWPTATSNSFQFSTNKKNICDGDNDDDDNNTEIDITITVKCNDCNNVLMVIILMIKQ